MASKDAGNKDINAGKSVAPSSLPANADNEDNRLDFSELKPGEYSLHVTDQDSQRIKWQNATLVYIERTRCLVHPDNDTELVDPMIGIYTFGKKQYTPAKKQVGMTDKFWGEHIFIEKNVSSQEEIKNGKVVIEVFDYNVLSKNALVGNYEMDLSSIYFEKDHCMKYRWLALTNVQKNYSKIMGYIKVSVCLIRAGDHQMMLEQEPLKKGDPEKNTEIQVMLPPQLQQKPGQIVFKIFRAEGLKKMDTFYSIDAYCVIECGGFSLKTDPVMDNKNPAWFKELNLPLFQPTVSQSVTLKLWDFDRGAEDELVGSCKFKLKDIMSGDLEEPFWCNIYGCQFDCENKEEGNLMSNNPELGTYWSGRILVSAKYFDVEEPQCIIKPLSDKEVSENKRNDDIMYGIQVDAFYGLQLPESGKKYCLTVRWADFFVQTKKIESKNGLIEWFERVKIDCKLPYKSSETLPDVFIYLTDSDGKHVSYMRESSKKYLSSDSMTPSNFFLLPDKSITKIRSDEAGVINATLVISYEGCQNIPNPLLEASKVKSNKKTVLSMNLYQCQDLIPGDSNGTSDPYVEVYFYGNLMKFPVKEDTNNPIWYKTYQLPVNQFNEANPPPILIRVFDEDTLSNDFLGSTLVDISEGISKQFIGTSKSQQIQPKWLNLKFNKNSSCGKILVSFYFDNALNLAQPLISDLMPKLERYRIQLRILGLRNLKSNGVMPVKRPFIKFDINSLKSIGETGKIASKNLFTEPKGFGNNPTLSTVIKFDCLLPEDLNLIPSLSCTVYDKIMFGLVQPIIGQFSINLQEYSSKTKERYAEKLLKLANMQQTINMNATNKLKKTQTIASKPAITSGSVSIDLEKQKKSSVEPFQVYDETKKILNEKGTCIQEHEIFWANYEIDKELGDIVEKNIPPSEEYLALSYDTRLSKLNSIRIKQTGVQVPRENEKSTGFVKEGEAINFATCNQIRKHYRYIVNEPLELSKFVDKDVFDMIQISQHRRFCEEDMFTDMVLSTPNFTKQGKFKGKISVVKHSDTEIFDIVQSDKQDEQDKDFMTDKYVYVRLYVIDATNIPQGDELDESDPYLKVKLGSQVQSTRKRFLKDNSSPKFGEMFEFKTCLPGDPGLKIQLWDYDELSGDDFLCETWIDLEDRFYSKKWRKLVNPPIETRPLFHPSSGLQKGELRMWLEIIPGTDYERVRQIYHVFPKPTQEFEVRCVIWDVADIPAQDVEDASDLFITARIGDVTKQTDIHYRALSGEGSYNWRMKFPITLPCNDPAISFQVFDKDLFSPDDFISSATISFENEAILAFENDKRVKMYSNKDPEGGKISLSSSSDKKFEKILIPLSNVKKGDSHKLEFKQEGKMRISFEIVPKVEADSDPVGIGRSEPNHSPHCPEPPGRFKWTMNPWDLFCRLVGPKARAKVCALICIILMVYIMILLIPTVVGDIIGDQITD